MLTRSGFVSFTEMDSRLFPFDTLKESGVPPTSLAGLPHVDLKPLWSPRSSNSKISVSSPQNLLAIPVGFKQKDNVDTIVQKVKHFVEGMAPVFSRSAWHCVWHLIQNDLVRGWGMDKKLGFCTQEHTVDARTEVRTCNMLAANKLGGNRRQSFVYSKSAGNKQWRRTKGGFIHSEATEDGSDEAFKAAESFA
ncbi:unnamed protein product [Ilex paraguariensis]|uniref:Uncharacterized protein n=1 Tax=Ilex paraguariensis TaxID=185542 RepID=A0ABC8T234_9AQUA